MTTVQASAKNPPARNPPFTHFLSAALVCGIGIVSAAETRVYRTEARGGEMREVAANFWSALPQGNANTVDLDAATASHPFTGLGVSIPESSCYLLSRLPAERRAEILRAIWTADGAGLSVARLQIGSSDYSMHAYTYDDVAGDTELRHFSIDPDRQHILPVAKEIQKIRPPPARWGSCSPTTMALSFAAATS